MRRQSPASTAIMRKQTLTLETGEGLTFTQEVASPFLRGMALLVDLLLVQAAFNAILGLLSFTAFFSLDLYLAAAALGGFLLFIGYWMVLEWRWRGQTIGKRLFRLRVVDASGRKLSGAQVALRNLLRPVDALPALYLLGGAVSLLNSKGQRLGDIAADTAVIRLPRFRDPNYRTLQRGKYNSFREYPHLAARLRQQVEPEEADLVLQAILRREALDPEARLLLYRDLADTLRGRLAFPEAATRGLTDEQYLRNCLEILYQQRPSKGTSSLALH